MAGKSDGRKRANIGQRRASSESAIESRPHFGLANDSTQLAEFAVVALCQQRRSKRFVVVALDWQLWLELVLSQLSRIIIMSERELDKWRQQCLRRNNCYHLISSQLVCSR